MAGLVVLIHKKQKNFTLVNILIAWFRLDPTGLRTYDNQWYLIGYLSCIELVTRHGSWVVIRLGTQSFSANTNEVLGRYRVHVMGGYCV